MPEASARQLLDGMLRAARQRAAALAASLERTRGWFPLTLQRLTALDEPAKEAIDAMILRYGQCVAVLQEQIFRAIARIEQENEGVSNRDRAMLMEKLGALKSADDFGDAVVLRNKFAHCYPEESAQQLQRLNLIVEESAVVLAAVEHIVAYVAAKKLLEPT